MASELELGARVEWELDLHTKGRPALPGPPAGLPSTMLERREKLAIDFDIARGNGPSDSRAASTEVSPAQVIIFVRRDGWVGVPPL